MGGLIILYTVIRIVGVVQRALRFHVEGSQVYDTTIGHSDSLHRNCSRSAMSGDA